MSHMDYHERDVALLHIPALPLIDVKNDSLKVKIHRQVDR